MNQSSSRSGRRNSSPTWISRLSLPALPAVPMLPAIVVLLSLGAALPAAPAMAQDCPRPNNGWLACATPWAPSPASLWGELQPADTSESLSDTKNDKNRRDITNFNEFSGPESSVPWFLSVDYEDGFVFTSAGYRFQVWKGTPNASNPNGPIGMEMLGEVKGTGTSGFPFLYQGESSTPLLDVDAPAGVKSVAAIVGYAGMGISIISTGAGGSSTAPTAAPTVVFQESTRSANEVYAARINGKDYAFMAQTTGSFAPTGSSLLVYDMTRAVSNWAAGSRCHSPVQTCPGVFLGRAGDRAAAYVDGTGNYVAYSAGVSGGFQILDASNPGQAVTRLTALVGQPVFGIAMWQEGSKYYVGLVTIVAGNFTGQILDVSCVAAAGGCSAAPAVLSSFPVRRGSAQNYVTFSRAAAKPFLHFGSDDWSGQRSFDREYLYDVSNPASPRIVSPPGYFSWIHNYNFVRAGRAKFGDQYLYRSGGGVFDVHKLVGNLPPAADFSWTPAEVYPGTAVTFADNSVGQPTSWSWTFPGGTPASSPSQAPGAVTFSTVGSKAIGLTVSNGSGPNSKSKSLVVLDPAPAIGGVTASQVTALVCQQVNLTSTGVTGKPVLAYNWEIRNPANGVMALTAPGNQPSMPWTSPPSAGAGTYTAKLTVSNQQGTVEKSVSFTLQALPTLRFVDASPKPTHVDVGGTVTFIAPASEGATTWQWDFGDGETLLTSDPIKGASPKHSYAVAGEKHVKVKIWNCITGDVGGLTSQELVINVNPAPLVASFKAEGCFLGSCLFRVNTPVKFTDASSGAQVWEYDWDGDGTFEDRDHSSPVTTHTFTAIGSFKSAVRVKRGTGPSAETSASFIVPRPIIISQGTNPPPPPPPQGITISGPSTGNAGQGLTFSASASGCSPASTGWTWNLAGGTAAGSTSTSSITIAWSGAGAKSISASNSGCGSFSDSHAVNIVVPGGGPLAPAFTYSPAAPKPGDAVNFDGSSSGGGPTAFSWDFGDGTNAVGSAASHVFPAEGTYQVKLTLTKPGSGAGCFGNICIATLTKGVIVGQGQVSGDFTTDAPCANRFGVVQCDAKTGSAVALTAVATDATTYTWEFGDNTTASGRTVSHVWKAPKSYSVRLTVTRGNQTASESRTFAITGAALARSVVLPSVAQTNGVLVQTSDLYVHNPGSSPSVVTLEFRKRGRPDAEPPKATRTIAPGATLFAADVLHELFGKDPNQFGFVSAEVKDGSEPVITSFNTTFHDDGSQFGQTIPGFSTSLEGAESLGGPEVQHLVGLSDDGSRVSYFGISNPNDAPATYRLRFFDKDGHSLGTSPDLTLSRFGQRQFQIKEIRDFGVEEVGDYRVEIETLTGGPLLPYGAVLRAGSDDPSFVAGARGKKTKVYLIGALGVPGTIGIWKSDVVLANVTDKVLATDMLFTRVGIGSAPEGPERITLQPGATERLVDVLKESWDIDDATGVLTFESQGANGLFPVVQGESYYSSAKSSKFGQAMQAFTDEDAAGPGQGHYLVGLRQDAQYRTTFWLFNPGSTAGSYDVIYRKLDGTILGRIDNVGLAPGRGRQFRPANHEIPAGGVAGGFTVQVLVKSGKVLAAGQVVNISTSDPAYIAGEMR